ncbi:PspA-associated protein PspAB [Streptosporangium sp. CA-115845]|uniref:PspA-associated protein PspAB n=1 Tax=Streptosporangium sp. CA-115845 TaxID=3240071 RepID=UPI003D8C26BD
MRWWDALLGRGKPAKADLDALFALPSAAVTLQAATDLAPTGLGAVCFRSAEGGAFAALERDITQLLDAGGGPPVEVSKDSYGYTWLLVRRTPDLLGDLVTDLHAVNSSLEAAGFGPSLLCSLVSFAAPDGRGLAMVYLYKQGTFYPFAPLSGPAGRRDNALELQVRGAIGGELEIEPDLGRWFPLWGAPGL